MTFPPAPDLGLLIGECLHWLAASVIVSICVAMAFFVWAVVAGLIIQYLSVFVLEFRKAWNGELPSEEE